MADERSPGAHSKLTFKINSNVPHAARIWNYWMGGKDHYEVDRAAGDAVAEVYPGIVTMATQSRQFLIRSVRFLAGEAGIHQFLDIGTGLPTMHNTHEVAQRIAPGSRIVYVDNDPLVLAHARALLVNTTPEGVTTYVDVDLHDPGLIISDARNVLNLSQPIAVMFMGVLGYVADFDEMRSIAARVMAKTTCPTRTDPGPCAGEIGQDDPFVKMLPQTDDPSVRVATKRDRVRSLVTSRGCAADSGSRVGSVGFLNARIYPQDIYSISTSYTQSSSPVHTMWMPPPQTRPYGVAP